MILPILSVKAQFTHARGFVSHPSRKLVCNFLDYYEIIADDENFYF